MATTPKTIKAWDLFKNLELAVHSNTTYVNGCFGASLDLPKNLTRYTKAGWNLENKDQILAAAATGNCFGFDCIGLIKSVGWWGWYADPNALYGGAVYKANDMPDCSVHAFVRDYCEKGQDIKTTSDIPFLAVLYNKDWSHIAIHIGNGIAIEATRYGRKPGVRYAYVYGVRHPLIKSIETRRYDAFATCKLIDYSELWKAVDAHGVMSVLNAIPDMTPPVQITAF